MKRRHQENFLSRIYVLVFRFLNKFFVFKWKKKSRRKRQRLSALILCDCVCGFSEVESIAMSMICEKVLSKQLLGTIIISVFMTCHNIFFSSLVCFFYVYFFNCAIYCYGIRLHANKCKTNSPYDQVKWQTNERTEKKRKKRTKLLVVCNRLTGWKFFIITAQNQNEKALSIDKSQKKKEKYTYLTITFTCSSFFFAVDCNVTIIIRLSFKLHTEYRCTFYAPNNDGIGDQITMPYTLRHIHRKLILQENSPFPLSPVRLFNARHK